MAVIKVIQSSAVALMIFCTVTCAGDGVKSHDDDGGSGGTSTTLGNGGSGGTTTTLGTGGSGGNASLGSGGSAVGGTAGGAGAKGGSGGGGSGGSIGGAGGSASAACSASNPAWSTSEGWALKFYDNDKLWIRNNTWGKDNPGAGSQAIWVNSPRCWGASAMHKDGTGQVKGFPQTVRGWSTGDGFKTTAHGLGIRVNDLTKAMIHWSMEAPEKGRYMALWDIYFHNKPNPPGTETARTSLMIFQRIQDDGYYKGKVGAFETVTFGGQSFKLEVTTAFWATGKTLVLYAAPTTDLKMGKNSMTLDLKEVIDGLRSKGHISATDDYLTSIQNGWEIIDGGEFKTTDYWTALQNEAAPP